MTTNATDRQAREMLPQYTTKAWNLLLEQYADNPDRVAELRQGIGVNHQHVRAIDAINTALAKIERLDALLNRRTEAEWRQWFGERTTMPLSYAMAVVEMLDLIAEARDVG